MSGAMRILDVPKRPDARLVAELGKMVTPHLSDSMERLYASGSQLRPMHKAGKLAGPAFKLLEKPHVFKCNYGLVSKGLEQLDLSGGKRTHFAASSKKPPNEFSKLTKRSC